MDRKVTNVDFDIFDNDEIYESLSEYNGDERTGERILSDDELITILPSLSAQLPLDKNDTNSSSDGYKMVRGLKALVKQNFKNLMLTSPGEKMMDPKFGVGLRRYLFQQSIQFQNPEGLKGRIKSQVKRYLPYIAINKIEFSRNESGDAYRVYISYFILPLNEADFFDYASSTQSSQENRGIL